MKLTTKDLVELIGEVTSERSMTTVGELRRVVREELTSGRALSETCQACQADSCDECGLIELEEDDGLTQVAPPGEEKLVRKLKRDPDVDNPWAMAWYIHGKKKGKK